MDQSSQRIRRQCSICQHHMWPQMLLYGVDRTWFKTVTSLVSIRDVTIQGSESVENQKQRLLCLAVMKRAFYEKVSQTKVLLGKLPSSLNSNTRQRSS